MEKLSFNRDLYSKTALIKAAYSFTDSAYIHLDADQDYYYVSILSKEGQPEITSRDFENEIIAQSARHEIYLQTKDLRQLLMARAVATSVMAPKNAFDSDLQPKKSFTEDEILKDWFQTNE